MLDTAMVGEQRLVHVDPSRLKLHPDNPRTHSKEQIKKIAASISRFGFRSPVLVDEHDNVLAGHGRLLAAAQLKLATVPTLVLASRLGRSELAAISSLDGAFDLALTGFDGGALEKLLELASSGRSAPTTWPWLIPARPRSAAPATCGSWVPIA